MPDRLPLQPTTTAALHRRLVHEQSTCRLPSVAAGLVRGGELVWSGAVGTLSGRADGEPSSADTQYRMGSITKTFVAAFLAVFFAAVFLVAAFLVVVFLAARLRVVGPLARFSASSSAPRSGVMVSGSSPLRRVELVSPSVT